MAIVQKRALVGTFNVDGIPIHENFNNLTDVFVGPDGAPLSSNTQVTNIENIYADQTTRESATYLAGDVGKVYIQSSDNTLWLLTNHDPQTWVMLGSGDQVYNYVFVDESDRSSNTYTTADVGKISRQTIDNTMWILTEVDGEGNGTWVQILTTEVVAQPNGVASLDENGKVPVVQVPDLDASKVTSGVFGTAQIPELDASKVTSGVFGTAQIPELDASKITSGVFGTEQMPNEVTSHIASTSNPHLVSPGQIGAVIANAAIVAGTSPKISYDTKGLVTGGEALIASDIPNLDAAKITSGTFGAAQIPDLDAAKLTSGTLDAARVPGLDASKISTGILDIARIPAAALERLVQVPDQAARFALTTDTVQLGDTVKQLDTGVMYVVVDVANLANAAGYSEYTAATAAAVPWSGITGKPSTFPAEAHTLDSHSDVDGFSNANPLMNGSVSQGTSARVSRQDHIHPTDTSREAAFTKNTAFNKNFGTAADTVCQGNDSRLSDSRTPTAHVLNSASHTVSGLTTGQFLKATSATTFGFAAHGLTAADVSAAPSSHVGATGSAHGDVTTSVAGFMTAADKTKLNGIATGATANTGTVTNVTGTAPISVANGTTTPSITISAATTGAAGSMSAADKSKLDGIATGATANTGTVTNVTGTAPISVANGTTTPSITISAATTSAAGSMSAADKSKLDGIAAGATANTAYTSTPSAATTTGSAGANAAYARGDHAHPSRIATSAPASPVNGDIWMV